MGPLPIERALKTDILRIAVPTALFSANQLMRDLTVVVSLTRTITIMSIKAVRSQKLGRSKNPSFSTAGKASTR